MGQLADNYALQVTNISEATTEQHLHDFFTSVYVRAFKSRVTDLIFSPSRFCGKITKVDFDATQHTAAIHFEKPSAAKTALMLNGGTLDGAHLAITSEHEPVPSKEDEAHHEGHIDQSDKPRAGSTSLLPPVSPFGHRALNATCQSVAAEYLARGYTLSDQILQRAIELDQQHGISNRFLTYIQGLDTTLGASRPLYALVRAAHL